MIAWSSPGQVSPTAISYNTAPTSNFDQMFDVELRVAREKALARAQEILWNFPRRIDPGPQPEINGHNFHRRLLRCNRKGMGLRLRRSR